MAIGGSAAAAGPEFDVRDQVIAFKRKLAPRREALKRAFAEVKDHVTRAVDTIRKEVAAGRAVVPELTYSDIRNNAVLDALRQSIRKTGCTVVRGVFPADLASDWFAQVGDYLETNHYEKLEGEKRSLDKYFSALKAGKPQVFDVYWSKPQVMARQDARLAETRAFLDRLWKYEGVFNPDRQCTYADRVRRRQPGDKTLGLSPHMDAGTVERWMALTRQGPKDGTLRLIPIAEGIAYVLLRALQDDVDEADLCGAAPGRALGVSPEWHSDLIVGLVSIPEVMPGDTVFWHTDICHAVADEHAGSEYASVIYIGSAPDCPKNRAYLPKQKQAFLQGRSAPDFAAMDFEVDFKGRATEEDLTDLGRTQMGF